MSEWMSDDDLHARLLASLEIAHEAFQRREAIAWLVMSYDDDALHGVGTDAIAGIYGPFGSPEEALVQAGKHDNASLEGFKNVVIPLYPPVDWKETHG